MINMGTQIVYIPNHAYGDIKHPDTEFGFVTSLNSSGDYFCRFWRKGEEGIELRTTANSELVSRVDAAEYKSCDQKIVDELILKLYPDRAVGI